MKTEFKIQVPEGMEIDRENSTFECIKFKPKEITYADISCMMVPYNYTVCTTARHHQKCVIFRKLLEVADYLNGDWKPDWNNLNQTKYFIGYNYVYKKFHIGQCFRINSTIIPFSSRKNVLKAIEIIGEEELKYLF